MNATTRAERLLRQRMAAEGLDGKAPGLVEAMRLFRGFTAEPFDCAEDALLWETGTYRFEDEHFFFASLTRQFTLEEDGGYDHMEQIHLTLRYPPETASAVPEAALWSFDCGEDFDAFFAAVERDTAFLALATGPAPLRCDVVSEAL